jgi:hypothetical protein
MKMTHEYLIEQTALTRLIAESNPQIFDDYYNQGAVIREDDSIQVITLPCDRYNFNWIEEGIDPEKTKVVHFKGGRHDGNCFRDFLQKLEIKIPKDVK